LKIDTHSISKIHFLLEAKSNHYAYKYSSHRISKVSLQILSSLNIQRGLTKPGSTFNYKNAILINLLEMKLLDPDKSIPFYDDTMMKHNVGIVDDDDMVNTDVSISMSGDELGDSSSCSASSSPPSPNSTASDRDCTEFDLKGLESNPKLLAIGRSMQDTFPTTTSHPTSPSKELQETTMFAQFRWQYLLAYIGIMLADGLQGTHLYVLYEGYGYSVASLYSLGFVSGAFSSPFTGAFVDKFGRKKAAMLYCLLEIVINYMEQYPILIGLVMSRVIGGITTNLLCSCFETWLVTEHRSRGFSEEKLEIILRDSGIVSNSAAILSGFLAHCLASALGPVGPFQGAVTTTFFALILVASLWTENYGDAGGVVLSFHGHIAGAFSTISKDSKISRIGLIQGLVEGALQTFVFLWSPALRQLSASAPSSTIGLDEYGEPAYGLIFGAFMACAVVGGFVAPISRRLVFSFLPLKRKKDLMANDEESHGLDPTPVNILCTLCYLVGAALLFVPCALTKDSPHAFSICFVSFMIYEFVVGVYVPSEGVIRSIYMPSESMCSIINILRIITNVAVALGVFSTTFVPIKASFAALSTMMIIAAVLQLSLIPQEEFHSFYVSVMESAHFWRRSSKLVSETKKIH